jgi:hypothetical protein
VGLSKGRGFGRGNAQEPAIERFDGSPEAMRQMSICR